MASQGGRSRRSRPVKDSSGTSVTGFLPRGGNFSLSWENAWAATVPRVRGALLRRGAPPDLIDEALQDAALQAWLHRGRLTDVEYMYRWATVTAWHVVEHEWGRSQRVRAMGTPDTPYTVDPARVVETKLELEAVKIGLAHLRPAERDAVLSAVSGEEPDDPKEKARVKERRHRGRRELRRRLEL